MKQERNSVLERYQSQLGALKTKLKEYVEKLKENERFKRLYAKDELKIKRLGDEILHAKRQRVLLAKKITEKAEEHRQWYK